MVKNKKSCIVCKKCEGANITYHRFPADKNMSEIWCNVFGCDVNDLPKYAYVCSRHFSPDDFNIGSQRINISKTAVPKLLESRKALTANGTPSLRTLTASETESQRIIAEDALSNNGTYTVSHSSSKTPTASEVENESSESTPSSKRVLGEMQDMYVGSCRRKRADKPGMGARLCSCHFRNGKKESGPEIFTPNEGKLEEHHLSPEKRKTLGIERFPRDTDAKLEWCTASSIDPHILTETSTISCDLLGQSGQRRNAMPFKNLESLTDEKDPLDVSNEIHLVPSSTSRKEQLEFDTVIEDVDDSRVSFPEVHEFPMENVRIKSPITVPSSGIAIKGLYNPNVSLNGFTPVKLPVPPLILVPAGVTVPPVFIHNMPACVGQSSVIQVPQTVQTANPFLQNSLLVSNNESPQFGRCKSSEQNLVNGNSTTTDHIIKEELESSSSTLTASEVGDETETSVPFEWPKKKKLIRYFGDISSDDMDSPPRARMCLNIARRTVSNLKGKLKQLRSQNHVLKQRVQSMTKLYSYLEENNYLNQYARAAIKAVLPEEADTFLTSQHKQT